MPAGCPRECGRAEGPTYWPLKWTETSELPSGHYRHRLKVPLAAPPDARMHTCSISGLWSGVKVAEGSHDFIRWADGRLLEESGTCPTEASRNTLSPTMSHVVSWASVPDG